MSFQCKCAVYSDLNHTSVVCIVYFVVIVAELFTVVYIYWCQHHKYEMFKHIFFQTIIMPEKIRIRSHPQISLNLGYMF